MPSGASLGEYQAIYSHSELHVTGREKDAEKTAVQQNLVPSALDRRAGVTCAQPANKHGTEYRRRLSCVCSLLV